MKQCSAERTVHTRAWRVHWRALALGTALIFSAQTYGCALLIAGGAAGAAAGGVSDVQAHKEEHHGPMTYAGTVLANIPYFPAKVVFAGLGATASGVTYLATLGKEQPANNIWDAAVKGNYVLTPSMIEGRETIRFVGTTTTSEPTRTALR